MCADAAEGEPKTDRVETADNGNKPLKTVKYLSHVLLRCKSTNFWPNFNSLFTFYSPVFSVCLYQTSVSPHDERLRGFYCRWRHDDEKFFPLEWAPGVLYIYHRRYEKLNYFSEISRKNLHLFSLPVAPSLTAGPRISIARLCDIVKSIYKY